MLNENQMNAAVAAAVGLLSKKKGTVNEGLIDLNGKRVIIDFTGTAEKTGKEMYTPTASIPMIPVLCMILKKTGAVGPNILNIIVEAMNEAIEAEEKGDEALAATVKQYEAAEKKVKAMLAKKLTPKERDGKFLTTNVTASIKVENVSEAVIV